MSGTITISPTLIVAPFVTSFTGPSGINNTGTILVNSENLSYEAYDGTYQRLYAPSYLGQGQFHAKGLNNDGILVGDFISNSGTEVGVIDEFGNFTTVSLDHEATAFTAVNDSGEAIGNYGDQAAGDGDLIETDGSFIDQNGAITMFRGPLGSSHVYIEGIDDAGEVVGTCIENGNTESFSELNGIFSVIDVPHSASTVVWNISDKGVIVGSYNTSSNGIIYGFIETNGTFTSVDIPVSPIGGIITGINDKGQFVGADEQGNYFQAAFTDFMPEPACFAHGTRILTKHGEIPVEALKIGDRVRTTHAGFQPIKWIGTRTYTAPFCNYAKILPIRIAAGAIADGVPARDLFVSPGHAIYVDGVLIHAARLLNGVTITQAQSAPEVIYFHIELENHEIILAENCQAETYRGECFRQQFQNAATFSTLYPGGRAPENFAALLLTHGAHLAAILRRLRARAGIVPRTRGPLTGYIDQRTPSGISGWALDLARPDEPVILDVMMGNSRLGRTIANIPRPDVAAAGYGAGNHGFEFALPPGVSGAITVRRAADGALLPFAGAAAQAA